MWWMPMGVFQYLNKKRYEKEIWLSTRQFEEKEALM